MIFHFIPYGSTQEAPNENQEAGSDENAPLTEAEITLAGFWPTISDEIKRIKTVDAKNQVLPLARIKKIMKLDEDVKMISAEAPLLFAKAAEIFIHELTLRAWVHTENNKRRTLQRNDIAMAITKFDQFDFLIDIVPREEIKPQRKDSPPKPLVNSDQVQYYLQLAQQHQQALQGSNNNVGTANTATNMVSAAALNAAVHNTATIPSTIQLPGQLGTPITINANGTQQSILVTNTGQPITTVGGATAVVNNLGSLQAAPQPSHPIQLLQQIVTPNGEIQHVPVSMRNRLPHIQVKGNQNSTNLLFHFFFSNSSTSRRIN